MARLIYSVLFTLAMPLVWLRLCWRARKHPEYLQHLGERHGFYAPRPTAPLVWLHAASVGETRAAEPLIAALLDKYPQHALLLTHMTPTGRTAGRNLVVRHRERILQAYLPYDLPLLCGRFLDHFRPQVGLLMETEIWPNLIEAAIRRDLPLALINARLSERSLRGYARLKPLIVPAVTALASISAQSAADAERLQQIGALSVGISGNLKFDVTPSPETLQLGASWRRSFGSRPVWLAASTRKGEEALILEAFTATGKDEILLVLVPRHPQRFAEVADLIAGRRLSFCRRSDGKLPGKETQVWLGDSMGEMAAYYAFADLALIGGTLLPFGGQNLIEAAACGCPVLLGPHRFNFAQACSDAIACGAAQPVVDAGESAAMAESLLGHRQRLLAMRAACANFSQAHRGATLHTLALIARLMARRAGS